MRLATASRRRRCTYNVEQQVKPASLIPLSTRRPRACARSSMKEKASTSAQRVRLVPEDGSREIGIASGFRIAHECLIGRPLLIPRRVKRFAAPAALKESGTAGRSGVHESAEDVRATRRARRRRLLSPSRRWERDSLRARRRFVPRALARRFRATKREEWRARASGRVFSI